MFRKHFIRFESTDVSTGDTICIAKMDTEDKHNTSVTDTDSNDGDNLQSEYGVVAQNERYMKFTGPVTVHGYSLRVWGNFFGSVYQGLSREVDGIAMDNDKNGINTHMLRTGATINTTNTSDLYEESAVKNAKYLPGWSAREKDEFYDDVLTDPESAAMGIGVSQTLGYTHLQKKFSRKNFKHKSKGNYRKDSKSGFVLIPNSDTECMTWNVKHILPDSIDNRSLYVDLSIWMSFDQR